MPMKLKKICKELYITKQNIVDIANAFQDSLENSLLGKPSALKSLPSFLGIPSGREEGRYVALDFGGTNIRVMMVRLLGNGCYEIEKIRSSLLKDRSESYDYTSKETRGEQLFDFVALNVKNLINSKETYILGHTFSYPCFQANINEAKLISWTKEMQTTGVEGKNVNAMLARALQRCDISVTPVAIINDTVGTLLASAYDDLDSDIASICGTGHNTCYLEPVSPLTGQEMIINLESGNFNILPFTKYDNLLDDQSDKPKEQRLEKMVAGQYLGELIRIILKETLADDSIPEFLASKMLLPYSIKTEEIACWINDERLEAKYSGLREVCKMVFVRSARLVAATYLGIIQHIDPNLERSHTLAIDGTLYERAPLYAITIEKVFREILKNNSDKIRISLVKEGSGIGAAVAASIAYTSKQKEY